MAESDPIEELESIAVQRLTAERPHIKRRKTFQDWVATVGGMVAIIGSIGAGASFVLGTLPFVRTDLYAQDLGTLRAHDSANEALGKTNATALQQIQRTGLLNLQLQLKLRIDILNATINQAPRGSSLIVSLQAERNAAEQQLDEITRQLNR